MSSYEIRFLGNITILLWLKEAGEKEHVNFSQILQKGVKEYLRIQ